MSESSERSGEPVSDSDQRAAAPGTEETETSGRKTSFVDKMKNRLTGHEDDAPRGHDRDEGTGARTGADGRAGTDEQAGTDDQTGTDEQAGTGGQTGGDRTGTGDRSDVTGTSTHTTRTREVLDVDEVTSEAHHDKS